MKLFAFISIVIAALMLWGCDKTTKPVDRTPYQEVTADKSQDIEDTDTKEENPYKKKAILEAIKVYRTPTEKKENTSTAYELAWSTLVEAGDDAVDEIKKELYQVESSVDGDPSFETAASLLLFAISGLKEADLIGKIWSRIPLTINYDGIFNATKKAAETRDKRALPMMKALLLTDEGLVISYQTKTTLIWPLTHEIIWGVYGPPGLRELNELLKSTSNSVTKKSAIRILATAGYIDALKYIRKAADEGIGPVKLEALSALGVIGHPEDFDRLVASLSSERKDEVRTAIYALLNYEDLRAVDSILPLANAAENDVKAAALSTLSFLLTPSGAAVLNKCAKKEKDKNMKAQCEGQLNQALQIVGVSRSAFFSMTKKKQQELADKTISFTTDSYTMGPDDKKLTREQFVQTLNEWIKNQTIMGGIYDWVRTKHVVDIAGKEDIDKLLAVRAGLYSKMTSQSLREVGLMNEIIKHAVRKQYRKETGICKEVVPK